MKRWRAGSATARAECMQLLAKAFDDGQRVLQPVAFQRAQRRHGDQVRHRLGAQALRQVVQQLQPHQEVQRFQQVARQRRVELPGLHQRTQPLVGAGGGDA